MLKKGGKEINKYIYTHTSGKENMHDVLCNNDYNIYGSGSILWYITYIM